MYFVLYDKDLKSIGEPYILESWTRTMRAIDFDDIKIVGDQIPYSADPYLVVINDRQGKMMFSGLASTPSIDDKSKKTSIVLKDYFTLLNSEIILRKKVCFKLGEYIDHILNTWMDQVDVGLPKISWDLSYIKDIPLDPSFLEGIIIPKNVKVYSMILNCVNLYGLYYESTLDLSAKNLTLTFKKASQHSKSIRLSDFGNPRIDKSFGDINRVTIYDHLFNKKDEWALTKDNTVVRLPSTASLVFPAKNKNFIAEEATEEMTESQALNNAIYEAVSELSANRYQENIDIVANLNNDLLDFEKIDFSTDIDVYTNEGFYRRIPVGEVEKNSSGTHIVRLGHRVQELTQEI